MQKLKRGALAVSAAIAFGVASGAAPASASPSAGNEAASNVPGVMAADEWTDVGSWGTACNGGDRTVYSQVRDGSAFGQIRICWNGWDVRVFAAVADGNGIDGYHAEARIRYKVRTASGWSDWHYRAPAAAYGGGAYDEGGPFKANQDTTSVQAAVCLYNGSTLIDCDDDGWQ
ncbi:hypothetical protein C5N14_12590 [Micromonospora sp. MW-13]|uniref:hypothetical protein n=1 Tax=Micromonospora sp. MW-13 TaxID=2094022 RepID=UPI000EC210FB|nr:hypothetical protein [Micromonospora sp. MW-13]RGC68601.1 hypothetical protein C5N14_12590 [Micromonospora sp. MW-13]